MKRSTLQRRTPLKLKSKSETAQLKEDIQALVRQIVILRDGGCILRFTGNCNGFRKDGQPVLQADHLITRANSATYADTRLIVCVCRGHHGWKKWHEREYNALLKTILPPDSVTLWERAEHASWQPHRTYTADWKKEKASLEQELRTLRASCAA